MAHKTRRTLNKRAAKADFPFVVGDIVTLRSGGGQMTVLDVINTCGGIIFFVNVGFFLCETFFERTFDSRALVEVDDIPF